MSCSTIVLVKHIKLNIKSLALIIIFLLYFLAHLADVAGLAVVQVAVLKDLFDVRQELLY